MITINDYSKIKLNLPKLGEKFEIEKGKRKAVYKIIESENFEGAFDLIRCENMGVSMGNTYIWREKHLTGCGSIEGCVKQAYDHT
jgi:hypothetical protein